MLILHGFMYRKCWRITTIGIVFIATIFSKVEAQYEISNTLPTSIQTCQNAQRYHKRFVKPPTKTWSPFVWRSNVQQEHEEFNQCITRPFSYDQYKEMKLQKILRYRQLFGLRGPSASLRRTSDMYLSALLNNLNLRDILVVAATAEEV